MSSERSGFKACGYIWGAHNVFTPAGYCGCVKDKDIADPAPIVTWKGDTYIVASGAVGDWAGHDNDIAIYNGSGWDFVTPKEGAFVYVRDEDVFYLFDGSSWVSEIAFNDLKINGDILPKDDNTSDLGSSTKRFAEVHTVKAYIKDGTLYIKGDAGTWRPIEFHAGDDRVFVLTLDTNEDLQIRRYVSDAYQDTPLFIDSSTGKVGILNTSPAEALDVDGNIAIDGYYIGGRTTLKAVVYYNDTSPKTLFSLPADTLVTNIWGVVRTPWNGTGDTIEIGDSADNDGLALCGISPTNPRAWDLAVAGLKGERRDKKGDFLWDAGAGIERVWRFTAANTDVNAYITAGSSTAGELDVYLEVIRLP